MRTSPHLDRSVWVRWVFLNMLCFGLGGTALALIASPAWLWIIVPAIVLPHWLVLRPTFRNTDDLFGLGGLMAGWLLGAMLCAGLTPLIAPQRRGNWMTLLVVSLIVSSILGLLLYTLVLRKSYERVRRWAYSAIVSVVLGGMLALLFLHTLTNLGLVTVLIYCLSAVAFGLSYGLISAALLIWVRRGKDGVTTPSTSMFSAGLMDGFIATPHSNTILSGPVTISGEVAVWNSSVAIWKRTIHTVEIWIDGTKRGEATLHPLVLPQSPVNTAHCAFSWEWRSTEAPDGDHLIVVQVISNQNSRAQASVQVRIHNQRHAEPL